MNVPLLNDGSSPGPLRQLRATAGHLKRGLLSRLEQRLHAGRKSRAIERIRSIPDLRYVLFLCFGNVCRSPYADARFREGTGGSVASGSAGFIGPGRPPPPEAVEAARARGLDTSGHRSRLVTPEHLEQADLVVVMDAAQLRRLRDFRTSRPLATVVLGDLDPGPIRRRAITDPWGQEDEVYARVFDRIDRCVGELLVSLSHQAERMPRTARPRSAEGRAERTSGAWSPTTSR